MEILEGSTDTLGGARSVRGRRFRFRTDRSGDDSLFLMFCFIVAVILLRHWLDLRDDRTRRSWEGELDSLDTLVGADNGRHS